MMTLQNLIVESEERLKTLPQSYFINYFEKDFLIKLKEINKDYIQNLKTKDIFQKIISLIYEKSNELADSYPVAQFQDEIKKIIKDEIE